MRRECWVLRIGRVDLLGEILELGAEHESFRSLMRSLLPLRCMFSVMDETT